MSQKYEAPSGPPPAYGTQTPHQDAGPATPQPAHIPPQQTSQSNEYYNASPYGQQSPYQQNGSPYPGQAYPQQENSPYPPQQHPYGYPQQGYQQQGGYGQPAAYYQQGPYQQQGPYYQPQGQYYDNRGGAGEGFLGALIAGLACCCCIDACLLF